MKSRILVLVEDEMGIYHIKQISQYCSTIEPTIDLGRIPWNSVVVFRYMSWYKRDRRDYRLDYNLHIAWISEGSICVNPFS